MLPSIRTAARRALLTTQPRIAPPLARAYAPSITYSGGQASEGQGGFYGSGGALPALLSSLRRETTSMTFRREKTSRHRRDIDAAST